MTRGRACSLAGALLVMAAAWLSPIEAATGPPEGTTIEQIFADIGLLEELQILSPEPAQLKSIIAILERLQKQQATASQRMNQPDAVRALWTVRTRLLRGEEDDGAWEPAEWFAEFLEEQEEQVHDLLGHLVEELRLLPLLKEKLELIAEDE